MNSQDRWAEAVVSRLVDPERMPPPARIWQHLMGALHGKVGTRRANEWARSVRLVSVSEDEAIVAFADHPSRDACLEGLHAHVQDLLRVFTNRKTRLQFVVDPLALPRHPLPPQEAARHDTARRRRAAAPGREAPLARDAAELCADLVEARGRRALFLWDPSGAEKTNLLDRCREALQAAGKEVVTMSGDHFRSLFESARREERLPALRARLRSCEALLVEDAHRWARGAEGLPDLLVPRLLVVASQLPLVELPALRRALAARGGTVRETALARPPTGRREPPGVEDAIEAVARAYGLRGDDLTGTCRRAREARQVCLCLARRVTGLGPTEVARQVGGRPRGAVHRAVAEVEERRARDAAFDRRVSSIEAALSPVQ